MSELFTSIKNDQLFARKAKLDVESKLLTTILGELETLSKNPNRSGLANADIVGVLKKFLNNLKIVKDAVTANAKNYGEFELASLLKTIQIEETVLKAYLPQQITEKELEVEITKIIDDFLLINTPISFGKIMQTLKDRHTGKYDGKEASTIINQSLKRLESQSKS